MHACMVYCIIHTFWLPVCVVMWYISQLNLCIYICRRLETPKRELDDINLDQFLKIANYEDTVKELDIYYGIGKCANYLHMNEFVRLIYLFEYFSHSQTAIASFSKSNFGIVPGVIDRHRSWQCA